MVYRIVLKYFPRMLRRRSRQDIIRLSDGLLYLLRSGCQWRMLPDKYPPWWRVYRFFRQITSIGLPDRLVSIMHIKSGTDLTKVFVDSQSVKWGVFGSVKGIDGHKKVKGIKRHIVVDSQGLPLTTVVSNANADDRKGALQLFELLIHEGFRIQNVVADKGYSGKSLADSLANIGVAIECVKSNFPSTGFVPGAGRWVVERTFAWFDHWRRLRRNYETLHHTERGMAMIACAAMIAARLSKAG